MRWSLAINGLGVLAGAGYTGFAFTPSHTPLWGGIATLLFLIGLFVPLAAEYGSLNRGFREVGENFVETRRRERGLGPAQEVFGRTPPAPAFKRAAKAGVVGALITALAIGLLAYDIWERQSNRPPTPEQQGVISNF